MNRVAGRESEDIIEILDSATGLSWNPPPAQPSFLRNGYHVEVAMIEAPYFVRQLQGAAIEGTGRQRAIVFEALKRGRAMINLPKEVAESAGFQQALHHAAAIRYTAGHAPHAAGRFEPANV